MKKDTDPVYVTQPSLPPLNEFIEYLADIWESKWITNNGKFHQELEEKLASFLGVKYLSLFSNGTLALITALQTQKITSEVITTPYSFVATTNALHWNNVTPVFVDIDPKTCNINPENIESAISSKTSAILPVHVYGTPCDFDEIQRIADKYGLKVIYDAAHAFGVKKNKSSILNYPDLSILSFHATKIYNTIEGGAIISHDQESKNKIDFLKNFGFADELTIVAPGINAKMNELQAAFGILQLKSIEMNIEKNKKIHQLYKQKLLHINGIRTLHEDKNVDYNYSYFPIFVEENYPLTRDELYLKLKSENIYGRRYFYPLISDLHFYNKLPSSDPDNLPIASKISKQVICLPIFPDLDIENIYKTISIIENA